ncbi:MAG TPA: dNTP triphosphohydrolase [Candidatus Binataceae bacterium]|jgi:dGTPase
MDTSETNYRTELQEAVERAASSGATTLQEVLDELGGADPRAVEAAFRALASHPAKSTVAHEAIMGAANARRKAASLPDRLPAADPMRSQWWFTLDTVVSLAEQLRDYAGDNPVAFIGSPTVAAYYADRFANEVSVFDADPDIIRCLDTTTTLSVVEYDVVNELPSNHCGAYRAVLVDPPWYPKITELFLLRSRELLGSNGTIFCVLPSRLTRPALIEERTELLQTLLSSGCEVVALESHHVKYRVPQFEAKAYEHLTGFTGRPWRRGDLLVLRVNPDTALKPPADLPRLVEQLAFARDPRALRFFLAPTRADASLTSWLEPVPGFESSVSNRTVSPEAVALWSSRKHGAKVRDAAVAQIVLSCWAADRSGDDTIPLLISKGITSDVAHAIVSQFAPFLNAADESRRPFKRRTPDEMAVHRAAYLSEWSPSPSKRQYEFHDDKYRLGFQRDRDRILWSHSLSRLGNKTQVFPVESDDHLRRRLRHTIEVMQLATTIAASFGLDRDLTEAGALAHDIGHCAFGHAGEYSLDQTLDEIDKRLGGFNHYEHGVDVVRWLEDVYRLPAAGGFPGLNLTAETVECIIKHTYWRSGDSPICQDKLMRRTKHQDLDKRTSHLEGQAVRAADKISYLISDLEDGIRMGVIRNEQMAQCRLFDRAPIDLQYGDEKELYEQFISQRRAILNVLMEDILQASDQRLRDVDSLDDVRGRKQYVIDYSTAMSADVTEIWNRLQKGALHKDGRVVAANMRAATITRDLLLLYTLSPQLIEHSFASMHSGLTGTNYVKWYDSKVGQTVGVPRRLVSRYFYEQLIGQDKIVQGDNLMLPTSQLVMAKDYVASLTDTKATSEHRRHILGSG